MQKSIQKAANKKANSLMKSGRSFDQVWKSIELLFPSADIYAAMDYANEQKRKREA